MSSDFGQKIDDLIEQSGEGHLVGRVEVDQVYAHYQEVGAGFEHPDGGQAYYLRDSLFNPINELMGKLSDSVLKDGRGQVESGMLDVVQEISHGVYVRAPLEFGDLKGSAAEEVKSNGSIVHVKPPNAHRLDPEELKAKEEIRDLFDPNRYRR